MINVLHMVHKFYPIISGTSERMFYSQPTDGIVHHIVRPCYNQKEENYEYEKGFKIYTVRVDSRLPGRLSVYPRVMSLYDKAVEIIKKERIDIIYGHSPQVFAEAALNIKKSFPQLPILYEF